MTSCIKDQEQGDKYFIYLASIDFCKNSNDVVSYDLAFEQLTLAQGTGANANDTLISLTSRNELLAILNGVEAIALTSANFVSI